MISAAAAAAIDDAHQRTALALHSAGAPFSSAFSQWQLVSFEDVPMVRVEKRKRETEKGCGCNDEGKVFSASCVSGSSFVFSFFFSALFSLSST
jgi:hypothetical protein